MKKLVLLSAMCGFAGMSFAAPVATSSTSASQPVAAVAQAKSTNPTRMMEVDPSCEPLFQHMKDNQKPVMEAIKANDANKVGTLVIANYKWMEDFNAKNPQCKPPKRKMMHGMVAQSPQMQ